MTNPPGPIAGKTIGEGKLEGKKWHRSLKEGADGA